MSSRNRLSSLAALVLAVAACAGGEAPVTEATLVATAQGFSTPESAIWDADQGVWFVTSINGIPSDRDGNGFISRVGADGTVETLRWVEGGRDGVVLHAPKGTALQGDTLWVADIDAIRGFDRRTGAFRAAIEFGEQAQFLNDIAVGPDGALYVTDTGIEITAEGVTHPGTDRVFKVSNGMVEIIAEGDHLGYPNGIVWDAVGERLVVGAFNAPTITALSTIGRAQQMASGPGGHDGIVILADGRLAVSSWADSTISAVSDSGTTVLIRGQEAPADIGYDPARGIIAIPRFYANIVEFWRVP